MKDMKDVGSRRNQSVRGKSSGSSSGAVSFGAALLLSLGCGAAAFYVGDRAGYARASAEATSSPSQDQLSRLDCMAKVHKVVTAAKVEPVKPLPPPPVTPVDFGFHQALKGGAKQQPLERPVDPLAAGGKTMVSAAPASQAAPLVINVPKPEPVAAKEVAKESPKASPGLAVAPGSGDFALQVGAFPNKQDALKLHDRLKGAGYRPAIVPSEVGGSTWYRVRVGRFQDRNAAEAATASLQAAAQVNGVPVKH